MTDFPLIWKTEAPSPTGKLVLLAIGFFSRRDGVCYAKRSTLSKATGFHVKTIDRALAELKDANLIRVDKRYGLGMVQLPALITITLTGESGTEDSSWDLEEHLLPDQRVEQKVPNGEPQSAGQPLRAARVNPPAERGSHIDRLIDTTKSHNEEEGANAPDLILMAFNDWNETAKVYGLPEAQKLTDDRKKKLGKRIEQNGIDGWRKALLAVGVSKFLRGQAKGDRPFACDLDFLLQPSKFQKVIEGGYGSDAKPLTITSQTDRDEATIKAIRGDRSWQRTLGYAWEQDRASWPRLIGPEPGKTGCILERNIHLEVLEKARWSMPDIVLLLDGVAVPAATPPSFAPERLTDPDRVDWQNPPTQALTLPPPQDDLDAL